MAAERLLRGIIHLDMDAFYASVEVLDNPDLRGRPVIVGGGPERGVVSAASYEARQYGIHSAMPMAHAMRRCPDGVFLPPRLTRYRQISKRIFAIFEQFTPLVEPLSLDEAFLDVTRSTALFGPVSHIAARVRRSVKEETGLTVSAGVATSKLVAKIASDFDKPDGLTVVRPGEEEGFLAPLPISRLWGVGKNGRERLALLGVHTIGDLRRLTRELLEQHFGRHGRGLYLAARGLDDRKVRPVREIKSVSHEETFEIDVTNRPRLRRELLALAGRVARRLRRYGLYGRTVTLKVTYGDFSRVSRSKTMPEATDDGREIHRQALELLERTEAGRRPVRLVGIAVTQLRDENRRQGNLFADPGRPEKQRRLNLAVDAVTDKFGITALMPGSLLGE